MHSTSHDLAVGDVMDLDADWFERAKAWIGGSLAALLGALFPFFRERLKKKNEQLSKK